MKADFSTISKKVGNKIINIRNDFHDSGTDDDDDGNDHDDEQNTTSILVDHQPQQQSQCATITIYTAAATLAIVLTTLVPHTKLWDHGFSSEGQTIATLNQGELLAN